MSKEKDKKNVNTYEMYFLWWLKELEDAGLAKNIVEQPDPFVLSDPVLFIVEQNYKRKDSILNTKTLHSPISYTCDFKVDFSRVLLHKLYGQLLEYRNYTYRLLNDDSLSSGNVFQNTLFYTVDNDINKDFYTVYFDVKPTAQTAQFVGSFGSYRDFKFNQRLTLEKCNIYVNKVVPIGQKTCLFSKTFVPRRYLFTDGGNQVRKKKTYMTYKTLDQYIEEKQIIHFNK